MNDIIWRKYHGEQVYQLFLPSLPINRLAWCLHCQITKIKYHRLCLGPGKCTHWNGNHKHNNHVGPTETPIFYAKCQSPSKCQAQPPWQSFQTSSSTDLIKYLRYTNKWVVCQWPKHYLDSSMAISKLHYWIKRIVTITWPYQWWL